MKKLLLQFICCLIILVILSLCGKAFAGEDCPYGEKNCIYPGKCPAYTDTNQDSICVHSQPAPETKSEVSETENLYTANNQDTIYNLSQSTSENNINISEGKKSEEFVTKIRYHLISIVVISIILYLFSSILSKKKIIRLAIHRKIWNLMLLISFFISSIFGILLIFQINFGTRFSLPFHLLFWHAEIGIVAFIIGIFHIIWHWKYFKTYFSRNTQKEI
ncbi:MAG: DUF4405 domain-containing protein [Candidatus Cloacimonetes bacterium]|nr:DUF4405 domain-containing protein [Candidatus Cloacimonadota bacterium]